MSPKMLTIVFVFVFFGSVLSQAAQPLENVFCGSYDDYVATDPENHRYTPYYVKIKRCHGRNYVANPWNMDCMPRKGGVKQVNFTGEDDLGNQIKLQIENHTDCSQQCIISQANCTRYEHFNEKECDCKCKITDSRKGKALCKAPFIWQQAGCNCVCPHKADTQCGPNKLFDTEQCGCTCKPRIVNRCMRKGKLLDEKSCLCIDPTVNVAKARSDCEGGVNGAMLAVVVVVEAVVIVFCYFFFFRYCYNEVYLGRKHQKQALSITISTPTEIDRNDNRQNGYLPHREKMRQEEEEAGFKRRHNGISDKERMQMEEEGHNFSYHPDEETSPLAPNHYEKEYLYNNDMRPPSSLDNQIMNIPPEYSDIISDFSEEGSVTQV